MTLFTLKIRKKDIWQDVDIAVNTIDRLAAFERLEEMWKAGMLGDDYDFRVMDIRVLA